MCGKESKTVVVVDDEQLVQELISEVLQSAGWTVLTASNPAETVALAAQRWIDLMVVDVALPGQSGVELAKRLAPEHPEMKVLFVSGWGDEALLETVRLRGWTFLRKPFRPGDLVKKVREITGW